MAKIGETVYSFRFGVCSFGNWLHNYMASVVVSLTCAF